MTFFSRNGNGALCACVVFIFKNISSSNVLLKQKYSWISKRCKVWINVCLNFGTSKIRDMTTYEGMPTSEKDASMAELMEALRHSQTRAREAERAAKQAYAQKDHVVKLVFKQASHLFAYKQWLRLLQLENTYLQLPNNKSQSVSVVCPKISPQSSGKIHKTSPSRKRSCPQYDVSKYAVLLALGLGLAGAGFLLGCTIGWMLPTW